MEVMGMVWGCEEGLLGCNGDISGCNEELLGVQGVFGVTETFGGDEVDWR